MSFVQKVADGAKNLGLRAMDLGGMASVKARDLTKKSSELLEYTRLKGELRRMEREMENNLAGIGALYYQQHSGRENVGEELERLLEATKELEQEMKELEQQIIDAQPAQPRCADCDRELPEGGQYCSYCGKKVVE